MPLVDVSVLRLPDRTQQREGGPAGKREVPKPRSISASLQKLAEVRSQSDGNGYPRSANKA